MAADDSNDDDRYRGKVTVFGKNVFLAPLLDTSEASVIVVRRTTGEPMAFLARIVDDTWAFANEKDPDWSDAKARFGVS